MARSAGRTADTPPLIKPFELLAPPKASSNGLTSKQRRAIFLDEKAMSENVDIAKNIECFGCDLSLIEFPEWQRTKHVHRLHPYLGKFIPQLVELFLRRFFEPGDRILDPFSGSGTTLVEANVLGIHSCGIELSPFNVAIQEVKTREWDIHLLRQEVDDIFRRTQEFSATLKEDQEVFETSSDYLRKWFAPRALQEILFYRDRISDYSSALALKIILSRAARSARLIPHYDLARPKEPLIPGQSYYCRKHRRQCRPVCEALKFLKRYSKDTVRRIAEFAELRTTARVQIIEGDTRAVRLREKPVFDGVFTSPPYVGMIDYHEQHRYAYELFPEFSRRDKAEIGPMSNGTTIRAKKAYTTDMSQVFQRMSRYLRPRASVFIVANDRHELYPNIIQDAGLEVVDVFRRPVPMRTERDTTTFFESIFQARRGRANSP